MSEAQRAGVPWAGCQRRAISIVQDIVLNALCLGHLHLRLRGVVVTHDREPIRAKFQRGDITDNGGVVHREADRSGATVIFTQRHLQAAIRFIGVNDDREIVGADGN